MDRRLVLLGALLLAAPAFSQQDEILELQLTESPQQILQKLGPPTLISPFGEFESWQYQIGTEDNHEFSHVLLFRTATGELVSVTRNWEHERPVDEIFPPSETTAYYYDAHYGVRVRRLSGERVLIAMGASAPGLPTGQIQLIRESALPQFHPWLKLRP